MDWTESSVHCVSRKLKAEYRCRDGWGGGLLFARWRGYGEVEQNEDIGMVGRGEGISVPQGDRMGEGGVEQNTCIGMGGRGGRLSVLQMERDVE